MPDVRKSKVLLWLVAVLVFLPSVQAVSLPESAPYDFAGSGVRSVQFCLPAQDAVLDYKLPDEAVTIVLSRVLPRKDSGKEAALLMLPGLPRSLCLTVKTDLRCFGDHRITLWRNIFYIHCMDGKKENGLLYEMDGEKHYI